MLGQLAEAERRAAGPDFEARLLAVCPAPGASAESSAPFQFADARARSIRRFATPLRLAAAIALAATLLGVWLANRSPAPTPPERVEFVAWTDDMLDQLESPFDALDQELDALSDELAMLESTDPLADPAELPIEDLIQ